MEVPNARWATKHINKYAAAISPPKQETEPFTHNGEESPSRLDQYAFRWKATVVVFVLVAELAAYIILVVYYINSCESHRASMTCQEATNRDWTGDDDDGGASIINEDGIRWISCYDSSGVSGQLKLSDAREVARAAADRDDDGFEETEICAASADMHGNIWDDDTYYTSEKCCNGWFDDDASCAPAAYCFDNIMSCFWEQCPSFMQAWSSANGAFAGVHVLF